MNKFIVVEVKQTSDGDFVEGVEFVQHFNTKEEALKFCSDEQDLVHEKSKKRYNYIKKFVKNLNFSIEEENEIWKRFADYPLKEIKNQIEKILLSGYELDFLKNYNPPKFLELRNLHIVEIKE